MLVSAWFLLAAAILKEHARLARAEHNHVKAGRAAHTTAQRTVARFAHSGH